MNVYAPTFWSLLPVSRWCDRFKLYNGLIIVDLFVLRCSAETRDTALLWLVHPILGQFTVS